MSIYLYISGKKMGDEYWNYSNQKKISLVAWLGYRTVAYIFYAPVIGILAQKITEYIRLIFASKNSPDKKNESLKNAIQKISGNSLSPNLEGSDNDKIEKFKETGVVEKKIENEFLDIIKNLDEDIFQRYQELNKEIESSKNLLKNLKNQLKSRLKELECESYEDKAQQDETFMRLYNEEINEMNKRVELQKQKRELQKNAFLIMKEDEKGKQFIEKLNFLQENK